jgi:hypothetical protein
MRLGLYLLASMVLAGAANAQKLPPVQYIDGAPACPRDVDIANIDTRLSARVIAADNQMALHQEKAKAIQCRMIGARYSGEDFKRMHAVTRGDN